MGAWVIELLLYAALAVAVVWIFYTMAFSSKEHLRRSATAVRQGFERRAAERADRRAKNSGPPPGEADKRQGPRRP